MLNQCERKLKPSLKLKLNQKRERIYAKMKLCDEKSAVSSTERTENTIIVAVAEGTLIEKGHTESGTADKEIKEQCENKWIK